LLAGALLVMADSARRIRRSNMNVLRVPKLHAGAQPALSRDHG
jgi:hypothetical protein